MKKQNIILTLILTFCLFYIPGVLASSTYERTESDYRVPSDIVVNSSNKSAVLKTPSVDETQKIYDFANLLTESEKQNLFNEVTDFISKTNYDLVIVTISYNNKNSAQKYADDFFDYNYFGKNSSRDGFLILIDMDNREIYISTSGYAIKTYSDSRIQSIIDEGFSDLKNTNYYECLSKMIDKSYSYFKKGFPSSNNNIIINNDGSVTVIKKMPYLMIAIISITFCVIMSSILYFKTSSKIKKENTVTYINPNLSNIIKNDQFLTTHTTKIRRESSSSSSGGGSSYHSSSSGRSHGGGGRHF